MTEEQKKNIGKGNRAFATSFAFIGILIMLVKFANNFNFNILLSGCVFWYVYKFNTLGHGV